MRVIGAGLPRTGTSTLEHVLTRLGQGPCYHARRMLERPGDLDRWLGAYAGEPIALRSVFDGFEATTDAPACFFWRELTREFPGAKVILSVRDPGAWYRSMRRTVLRRDLFEESADPALSGLRRLSRVMFERAFGQELDRPNLLAAFDRHTAQVRAAVPAGRLLVYDVAEGWEPLCAFLGVPVPEEPFPRLNTTGEFVANIERYRRESDERAG